MGGGAEKMSEELSRKGLVDSGRTGGADTNDGLTVGEVLPGEKVRLRKGLLDLNWGDGWRAGMNVSQSQVSSG